MPKKQEKTKAETSAEEYFPVDDEDLKHTTEKKVKESTPDNKRITEKRVKEKVIETVEKISNKKPVKRKKRTKTTKPRKPRRKANKKTTVKEKKYTPPEIKLKSKGYEFIRFPVCAWG